MPWSMNEIGGGAIRKSRQRLPVTADWQYFRFRPKAEAANFESRSRKADGRLTN